ncbi:Glycosyl hydrolase superfamily protein [Striga hermonthica]|uniref:Glycosyl hydrolase superfamily protein n=1 Tax=Striga hermonthica TaxID=68872 RepID=A0A9N7NDR7_STRHE|nr:Glycosyl hydrolase superfamily protein [Striga hermonthica]
MVKCLLIIVVIVITLRTAVVVDADIGACYGTLGDNLPPPNEVIELCRENNIRKLRLYNPNPSVLAALQSHGDISVTVGVPNEEITGISQNAPLAKSWVEANILNYPGVNFRYIAVGNEISPADPATADIAPHVGPAMKNIHDELASTGLDSKVKVSTSLSMQVLGQSYPPSAGEFRADVRPEFIDPIIEFLVATQSPLLVNVYPYFAYVGNTEDINLDFALFTSTSVVIKDGSYEYWNLFDAMVDAIRAALEKAGGASLEIVVSETGWPTAGGTATSVENACTYNSNLVESVENGTPRKPRIAIETYIFDLIDEDQKSPELEKHWGLFLSNKQPKYPLSSESS